MLKTRIMKLHTSNHQQKIVAIVLATVVVNSTGSSTRIGTLTLAGKVMSVILTVAVIGTLTVTVIAQARLHLHKKQT